MGKVISYNQDSSQQSRKGWIHSPRVSQINNRWSINLCSPPFPSKAQIGCGEIYILTNSHFCCPPVLSIIHHLCHFPRIIIVFRRHTVLCIPLWHFMPHVPCRARDFPIIWRCYGECFFDRSFFFTNSNWSVRWCMRNKYTVIFAG